MSNKKEQMRLAAGAAVIALLVLFLIRAIDGASEPVPADINVATTTDLNAAGVGTTSIPNAPAKSAAIPARPDTSTSGVIGGIANAKIFMSLLQSTGVDSVLRGVGPYTVFVPADSAFGNLPPKTIANMTAAEKKHLVQNHIVAGKVLDLDAVSSGSYLSLSKDALNFQVNMQTKVAYINSGYSYKQYKSDNGIIYVISSVLVPPQTTGGSPVPH
jgi:uncharacterized surface protein with fasciclin (FAS1) repeats